MSCCGEMHFELDKGRERFKIVCRLKGVFVHVR